MASAKDFGSGAIGGASLGFSIGGPWGAAIGGAAGGLLGIFAGSGDGPSLADVDLQRDNPDLWRELQQLQAMSMQYERLYAQRRMGPTAQERSQVQEGRGRMEEQQATLGMAGSSTGSRIMGEYNNQAMAAIQQRAFQEQQQLLAAQMQSKQMYAQQLAQGQQNALQSKMGQFQNQQQNSADRNQFMSGLVNAGIGMYGTNQYIDSMNGPKISKGVPSGQAMSPIYDYGSNVDWIPPVIRPVNI